MHNGSTWKLFDPAYKILSHFHFAKQSHDLNLKTKNQHCWNKFKEKNVLFKYDSQSIFVTLIKILIYACNYRKDGAITKKKRSKNIYAFNRRKMTLSCAPQDSTSTLLRIHDKKRKFPFWKNIDINIARCIQGRSRQQDVFQEDQDSKMRSRNIQMARCVPRISRW